MPGPPRVPRDPDGVPEQGLGRLEWALVAGAVLLGVALRVVTRSDLWLDEALSVNIAALPPSQLTDALRHDGHPPLYYLLLHGWMSLFGDGDLAVRSLSGLLSLVTLPFVALLGARRRGPVAGAMAVLVAAVLPFDTRYATEARMYALVMLLVVVGWYLLDRILDDAAGWWAVGGVAVVTSLLLYSHYWAIWLLAATGIALLACALRGSTEARRAGSRRAIAALVVGGLTFVPWLPVMLDQLAHTGTPWGARQRPSMSAAIALVDVAGGGIVTEATLGAVVIAVLLLLGLTARPLPPDRISVHLRTVPGVRPAVLVGGGGLAIGITVAWITGATFASRYASIAVPVVVIAAGLGLVTAPNRGARAAFAAVTLAVLGGAAVVGATDQRTQGTEVADAIDARAEAGDVVIVCPDQLGPALSRGLDADLEVVTHPSLDGPELVDWRDYEERNATGDPEAVAADVLERAGDHAVWLVWYSGYATYGSQCESLRAALARSRPTESVVVARPGEVFEPMWLERFPAA